jgi:exonuclease III
MAGAFPKPRFHYDYSLKREKARFDEFFTDEARGIPGKKKNEIDLASWNIANLGVQKRRDKDLKLIAHILSHFDIVAIQEVTADLTHFSRVMAQLGKHGFEMVVTDPAGSNERLAVAYKRDVIEPRELFGELDYNPSGRVVKGKYVISPKRQSFTVDGKRYNMRFYNFNRNPFLSTWKVVGRKTSFLLANVHIYFGEEESKNPVKYAKYLNRVAEVYYLADWAREQRGKKKRSNLYEPNIILIGDMNIPKRDSRDPVYRALKRRGLRPSRYSTEAGTTIQEFNAFDQVAFTGEGLRTVKIKGQDAVVVDFDNFVFKDLWADVDEGVRTLKDFKAWTKFALSDHRPLFVRLKV